MQFQIVFVKDHQLPAAQHWALVRTLETTCCFIKESRVTPATLLECWAAYRKVAGIAVALAA